MTGMAAWQRVVHYLGEALMLGGFGWAVYRMLVLHGCPTARFNDLSLIMLGLGIAIAPLHPFGAAPGYLSTHLLRNRGLAAALWALSLSGSAFAVFALWQRWPSIYWIPVMLPAAYYMWAGIAPGKPVVGAAHGPPLDKSTGETPAPPEVGAAHGPPAGRPWPAPTPERAQTPALPPSAPREADTAVGPTEECRLQTGAPRNEETRDA